MRTLAGLVAGVMLAHLLVLQSASLHLWPGEPAALAAPSSATTPFTTRRIDTPAPVQPAKIKPIPQTLVPKVPQAQSDSTQTAIDLIAKSPPPTLTDPATSTAGTANATLPEAATPPAAAVAPASVAAPALPPPPALPEATRPGTVLLPAPVRMDFAVTSLSKGLSYRASGELHWTTTGRQYQISLVASALFIGSRSLVSQGELSALGLVPTRFSDKGRSERAAHFLADQGKITFSANSPDVSWAVGAQDRASVFMQLAGMLAGSPASFPQGSSITLYTVGPYDADFWTFQVAAEEMLPLPQGQTPTLKLSRQPRRQHDQSVEVWFAPSLGYLPVRIRITQANGDYVDQQLKAISRP